MNNYSNHIGKSDCTEAETRRFSSAYKKAMEPVTVSPQLKERILRLQDKKIQPRWIKIVRSAACAAACLTIVLAARSWLVTESQNLSTGSGENLSTAAYSLAGDAAFGSTEIQENGAAGADSGYADAADQAECEDAAELSPRQVDPEVLPQQAAAPKEAPSPNALQPSDGAIADGSDGNENASPTDGVRGDYSPDESSPGEGSTDEISSSESAAGEDSPSPFSTAAAPETSDTAGFADKYTAAQGLESNAAVGNPLVPCSSAEEAEELLGWSILSPDLTDASLSLIDGSLFQASWENGQRYRMAQTAQWGDDISGDYNQYACAVVQNADRFTLTLKGNAENAYTLLIWTDGRFSYCWSSPGSGMTQAEAEAFVQSILSLSQDS